MRDNGRVTSGTGNSAIAAARARWSVRNSHAIKRPSTPLNTTAAMPRARPSSIPRIFAVSTIASTLIAGPEYKNADAGPSPAPIR